MDREFQIIEKELGHVLEIERRAPIGRLPRVIGHDFQTLMNLLNRHQVNCAAPPYARYLDVKWDTLMSRGFFGNLWGLFTDRWHFMSGVPTGKSLPSEGEIESGILTSRRYARTLHRGPYKSVGKTYKRLYAWIRSQNLNPHEESLEIYLNDPRKTPKDKLETEVLIPLR